MKSSFLPWLLAHLVYCLASTISQHGAVKWNSVGKTTKQHPMHFSKKKQNNDVSKGNVKFNILCVCRIAQL